MDFTLSVDYLEVHIVKNVKIVPLDLLSQLLF